MRPLPPNLNVCWLAIAEDGGNRTKPTHALKNLVNIAIWGWRGYSSVTECAQILSINRFRLSLPYVCVMVCRRVADAEIRRCEWMLTLCLSSTVYIKEMPTQSYAGARMISHCRCMCDQVHLANMSLRGKEPWCAASLCCRERSPPFAASTESLGKRGQSPALFRKDVIKLQQILKTLIRRARARRGVTIAMSKQKALCNVCAQY